MSARHRRNFDRSERHRDRVNQNDLKILKSKLDDCLFAGFEMKFSDDNELITNVQKPIIMNAIINTVEDIFDEVLEQQFKLEGEISYATVLEQEDKVVGRPVTTLLGSIDDALFVPNYSVKIINDNGDGNSKGNSKFINNDSVYIVRDNRVPNSFIFGPNVVNGHCEECNLHCMFCSCGQTISTKRLPVEWKLHVESNMIHKHVSSIKIKSRGCAAVLLDSKFLLSFKRMNLQLPHVNEILTVDFIKVPGYTGPIYDKIKMKYLHVFRYSDPYLHLLDQVVDYSYLTNLYQILELTLPYLSCIEVFRLLIGLPNWSFIYGGFHCKDRKRNHLCLEDIIQNFHTISIYQAFQVMSGKKDRRCFIQDSMFNEYKDVFNWKVNRSGTPI